VLFLLLRLRIGHMDLHRIVGSFVKTLIISLLMGAAAIGASRAIATLVDVTASKTAQILQLGGSMGLAVLVFFALAYFLRMEEAQIIIDMFKRRKSAARGD
jgi:hypothetical protein